MTQQQQDDLDRFRFLADYFNLGYTQVDLEALPSILQFLEMNYANRDH